MLDPLEVIAARDCGAVRYSVLTDYSNDLNNVLRRFGLNANKTALLSRDRATARDVLAQLFFQDLAYGGACGLMNQAATSWAERILAEHEYEGSVYYTNGGFGFHKSRAPFTQATYDAGMIITGPNHRFFCIWFEDED